MRKSSFWLGGGLSLLALWLAFRQVELRAVVAAFARADYLLVLGAGGLQLLVLGAIARRWGLLFRQAPRFSLLFYSLLIAQLANSVLPLRLGIFIRAYLAGKGEGQSRVVAFATLVAEKVFDSLALVLFFSTLIPFVAPHWFHWSSLRLSTGLFVALLPAMIVATYQRRRLLRLLRALLGRVPWLGRPGLLRRLEAGLEGLEPLQNLRRTALLWGWTLAIGSLGAGVNYMVLRAFGIEVPVVAAFLLLVSLQIGGRVLPGAPLAGVALFPFICRETLGLFSVDSGLALSFGFGLHLVVFVPGSILGVLALWRTPYSLRRLRVAARE